MTGLGVFGAHAASAATLMFNTGPTYGESIGSYRGDPLYHASLDATEYMGCFSVRCSALVTACTTSFT